MRSSYNFGELVSCLRVYMPPIFVECLPSDGGDLLLAVTTVVGSGGVDVSFWVGEDDRVLSWFKVNANIVSNFTVNWFISHQSLTCWLSSLVCWFQLRLAWWLTVHQTYYPSCWFLLTSWSLRYEEQYHSNIAMFVICSYMAQMGVNKKINWLNKCIQNVIQVEEVWEIGDRV